MLNTEDVCGVQIKPVPELVLSLQSHCASFLQVFMVNQFAMNLSGEGVTLGLIQDN